MKKGQFYIISAYMIAALLASIAVLYYPSYHRTNERIEKTSIVESVFQEIKREAVYAARIDPNNTTLLSDWIQYSEWYAEGKGLGLNMAYSTGTISGECDGYYNCDSDCTTETLFNISLSDNTKIISGKARVCWK